VCTTASASTASPLHGRHRLEQVEEQLSRVVEVSG